MHKQIALRIRKLLNLSWFRRPHSDQHHHVSQISEFEFLLVWIGKAARNLG